MRGSVVTRRLVHHHGVGTWSQVTESVQAATVGYVSRNGRTTCIEQFNGYPANAWLSTILYAIAVEVFPNVITNGAEAVEACIVGQVRFVRAQINTTRTASCSAGVAIFCIIPASIGHSRLVPGRFYKFYNISSRRQVLEQVSTTTIGYIGLQGST